MRVVALFGALAVALALTAGSAQGSAESNALIRPGVGIGPVRLGMTYAEVRRALGRPGFVNRRQERGFGTRYIEYLWNYGDWRVGLLGRRGRERVVRIATGLRRERTREGIGFGTSARRLARRYGRRAECFFFDYKSPDAGTWIVLRGPSARMTAFWLYAPRQDYGEPRHAARVAEVMVQYAWLRPPRRCTWDWTRQ